MCFKYVITAALNHEKMKMIEKDLQKLCPS